MLIIDDEIIYVAIISSRMKNYVSVLRVIIKKINAIDHIVACIDKNENLYNYVYSALQQ